MDIIDVVWKTFQDQSIGFVLTLNDATYRVYCGVGYGADEEEDKKLIITEWGAKLTFLEAKGFFPMLVESQYRKD